jgi:hypothetical protein
MKLYFKCKLLSDVVLTSLSATEGFHKSLDYIPGSKFLGIAAAKLYDEAKTQQTLNLFHNGKVKFGDAHISINGEYSYPTPFSWYQDKLKNEGGIYLYHDTPKMEAQFEKGIQLKQERGGYINLDGTSKAKIDQTFSIKSAYDPENRRSKDSQMYGYHALKAGMELLFTVEVPDNSEYDGLITDVLVGKKRVGRSRTAEYGLVEIKPCEAFKELASQPADNEELIFYAISDWCFIDEFGFPTTNISAADLGVPEGKIDWSRSQVRYRKYQSFNSKRGCYNEDRMVFQRGSVIIVKPEGQIDSASLPNWVGSLQSEGFGKVGVNPPFLKIKNTPIPIPEKFDVPEKKGYGIVQERKVDSLVLELVDYRMELQEKDDEIEKAVEVFFNENKNKFSGTTNSQWGAIRGIAKTAREEDLITLLFDRSEGFLCRGVAAEKWRGKIDNLENFATQSNRKILLTKLASKMQKYISQKEKNHGK